MTQSSFADVKSISISIIPWHNKLSIAKKHRFSGIKKLFDFRHSYWTHACYKKSNKTFILLVVWHQLAAAKCHAKATKILCAESCHHPGEDEKITLKLHFKRIYTKYVHIYGSQVNYNRTIVFLSSRRF